MKLEQQVVSLELAKKLKELGVKQESYFVWAERIGWKGGKLFRKPEPGEVLPYTIMDEISSAFTVAELGEIMRGKGMGTTAYSEMWKKWWVSGGKWIVENQKYETTVEADTEADARAKMLIYLLENGLLTNKE